jgi:hypothetical protein
MRQVWFRVSARVPALATRAMGLAALLAAVLIGHAGAQSRPPTASNPAGEPEELLQAIRSALIDAATDAPTRVVSSAWIDESGALQESAQWHSQLRVRGVRVLSYLDADGAADQPARPRWKVQPFLDAGLRSGAASPQECLDAARHWRMPVRFESAVEVRVHGPQAAIATLLAQQARQWWARHGATLPRWYAQDSWLSTSSLPVGASGALSSPPSAYQQALFGVSAPPPAARLRLTLSMDTQQRPVAPGAAAAAGSRPVPLTASLVFEDDTGRVLWRLAQAMPEAPREAFAGTAALGALEQALQQWREAMATLAPCDFPRFEARRGIASQWTLPVGTPSGFVPGQRVFIADRTRVPERILEPEALGQTALAEVVSVSGTEVTLRQIAGPTLAAGPRWVAWPL